MEHLHGNNGEAEDSCPACTGLHEIDTTSLKASIAGVESMLLEMRTEHQMYCEGFTEADPAYPGDPNEGKKEICRICYPED